MDGERKVEIIPLTRTEVSSTVELIGKDIRDLQKENKQLRKTLAKTRSRIIILEENYITLLEDLSQSAKIDLFIYAIFAICIAILGFYVYGLTH